MSTLVTMEATRIGICDDMPQVARELENIVSAHLDSIGYLYKTEKYYNGMDALSSADALDILFLDIEMPDMDGIETGRKVQERNPECRIIMATARTDRFKEAFKIRAFRFITKPFDKDEIQAALDETLQSMLGIGRIRILMQLYLSWNPLVREIGQSIKNTSSRLLESFRRQTVTDEDVLYIHRYTTVYLE